MVRKRNRRVPLKKGDRVLDRKTVVTVDYNKKRFAGAVMRIYDSAKEARKR